MNKNPGWSIYLVSLVVLLVSFGIICIPTSAKIVDILGVPLSISVFYFPFICIISDVVTEVYGFKIARQALWLVVVSQILACLIFQFVAIYPSSLIVKDDSAFTVILSQAPRLVLVGVSAMYFGDLANNYILAKMKLYSHGKLMALRFFVSTVFGQLINTSIFYVFALSGIIPYAEMLNTVLVASFVKVTVEIIVLPLSVYIAIRLKNIEQIDVYDQKTDFSFYKF